jgi:hypothetical protein
VPLDADADQNADADGKQERAANPHPSARQHQRILPDVITRDRHVQR